MLLPAESLQPRDIVLPLTVLKDVHAQITSFRIETDDRVTTLHTDALSITLIGHTGFALTPRQ